MDRRMGNSFFCLVIYWIYSTNLIEKRLKPAAASIKYITGYLIELSLSIDNIFVIAIIFSAFKIPQNINIAFFWESFAILFRGLMIYLVF
jgi:tellurite resistance protein TerC